MVFYVLATVINYPKVADTKARVDAHAKSAIMMCSVLFAAAVWPLTFKFFAKAGAKK